VRFEVLGEIEDVERIAAGPNVRVARYSERRMAQGRWRKMKGIATVRPG
jgi:hypothetical protein